MKVLVACESSGTVREAFRKLGHEAWSCDLLPADDGSQYHIQGDAITAIFHGMCGRPGCCTWDLVIAHPPCTYLSVSGLHWNKIRPERAQCTEYGAAFFMAVVDACNRHVKAWAIENPVGCMSTRYRKPDQIIQPYEYGDDASKKTCLWLHNLPALTPTNRVPGRMVNGVERWSNQTDRGQNRLSPSANRWKLRSKTYQGIADAMGQQWGAV